MAVPVWAATLSQTAVYVPWLTVSRSNPGSQTYTGTFSSDTSPSDVAAGQHIADAATLVSSSIATMPTALYEFAAMVTARLAAATLAAAYARTDEDASRAAVLLTAATSALAGLIEAADNAGAASLSPVPVLSAPDPVPWGDSLLIDGVLRTSRSYIWPE